MSDGAVTVEGKDLMDVRMKMGLGRNPDRWPMIEVDTDHGTLGHNYDHPPRFFRLRWRYGDDLASKGGLTFEQVSAEITRVLQKHMKWLASRDAALAKREAEAKRLELKIARKELSKAQAKVNKLKGR
jgi:hypothetical protein